MPLLLLSNVLSAGDFKGHNSGNENFMLQVKCTRRTLFIFCVVCFHLFNRFKELMNSYGK